jgi:N-methylhydantoinase B
MGRDGAGPFRTMAHGDTRIIPLELQEALYPYRYEGFCLRQDSGGPGRWRGGLGFVKSYLILAPCKMWVNFDRVGCPPWGVQGGGAGMSGEVRVWRDGADVPEVLYKAENFELQAGDRVEVMTGGGGGYGAPMERPVESVRQDVVRGYISREAAARHYGVGIAADGTARRV